MKKLISLLISFLICIPAIIPCRSVSAATSSIVDMDVDATWVYCNTLKEYEETIPTLSLPSNFIRYSQIQNLGEFVRFEYCILKNGQIIVWNYHLQDSSGSEFIFTVGNNVVFDPVYELPRWLFCSLDNIQTLPRGTYLVDGIRFISFCKKDAYEVQWFANGSAYNIFYLDGYDKSDTDSFLSKLADTRTAHQTVLSLLDDLGITHDLQITPVGTLRFVPVYVVSTLCLLLIGVWFIRREIRKRKQKYDV